MEKAFVFCSQLLPLPQHPTAFGPGRRQEGEENGESHGGRQGGPQRIQEAGQVDAIGLK